MALFRRKPTDPDARSPKLGLKYKDLSLLDHLVKAGANLLEPRHVVYYLYARDEPTARAVADDVAARGLSVEVREPHPEHPGQWPVVAETHVVTTFDFVRETTDFFEAVASRHGAEYDGWEAST